MIDESNVQQSQQEELAEPQQQSQRKKKRRHRPSTKGIRTELKTLIENAILDSRSDMITTLFSSIGDNCGTLGAPLASVFSRLQQHGHNTARFSALSSFALKSVSNRSRVFRIQDREGALWVLVNPRTCANGDSKTVYVDNLPPLCSAQKLRRRASLFGQVVAVHLPQIGRIQRRIGQLIGDVWPDHSGFGFVQFASKTAAKRFCKRYATNSRLKRIHHHHHGQRHGKKRTTRETAAPEGMEQQMEMGEGQQEQEGAGTAGDEQHGEGEEKGMEQQQPEENTQFEQRSGEQGGDPSDPVVVAATSSSSLVPPQQASQQQLDGSMCILWSAETADSGATMRFRCYSVAEESVMSESGNEMDLRGEQQEHEQQYGGGEQKGLVEEGAKIKRRRRRRKIARRPQPHHHHYQPSLNTLFRHIQVFPLKQYRELRSDYLRMKKTRMGTLKKQLLMGREKMEEEGTKDDRNKMEGMKEDRAKKKRKGRRRGIRKLMEQAERAKTDADNKMEKEP